MATLTKKHLHLQINWDSVPKFSFFRKTIVKCKRIAEIESDCWNQNINIIKLNKYLKNINQ